jgi:hypothetical protein
MTPKEQRNTSFALLKSMKKIPQVDDDEIQKKDCACGCE